MSTPLHAFLKSAELLKVKPIEFWPEKESVTIINAVREAIQKLKRILENKDLSDSRTYGCLARLEKVTNEKVFDEFRYIQTLSALVDVYLHAPTRDEKTKKLIHSLEREVFNAKKRIFEYHLLIEALQQRAGKLSTAEQEKADVKTLQDVGIFYVLEYTLQVLALWPRLNDKGKYAILHEGLKVKEGNLPAYVPLEDTFRKDFCLKLFDSSLRTTALHAFYNFEEVLATEDLKKIGHALKIFNLALLDTFQKKGLKEFKALIYKPFGNNIPIIDIISIIQTLHI